MKKNLLSLLAGSLLPLSLAPFNLYTFAFISPALLLWIWLRSSAKQACWNGWLFGLGFFTVGTSWIYISIHQFGNASILLAALLTAIVIAIVSFYFALFGFIFKRFFSTQSDVKNCLLVFPALWVVYEFARSVLLTGLPWNLLGYAQFTTPLSGFAPIFGIYGLSLITALISGALVLLITKQKNSAKIISLVIVFGWIGLSFVFYHHAWTKADGRPIEASIIQGNIPQEVKWDKHYLIQNINVYKHLTFDHFSSQLIVWPEGAFPLYPQEAPQFIHMLSQLAAKNNSNIIFGEPLYHEDSKKYYNGMLLIGKNQGEYLKRHLVPFGEYTPLENIFNKLLSFFQIPMSDFSHGPYHQKDFKVDNIRIAPFICFEVIFPELVLDSAEKSELLLSISDDSWFGKSIALPQQLAMSQMRSLETGRYQLIATNTGISAIVSPFGEIVRAAPIDQREVITENITPMSGKTPLMKWHYYPVIIAVLMMIVIALF